MDQPLSQPLNDWLPANNLRPQLDRRPSTPRHVHASALLARAPAAWPISEGVLASLQRSAALCQNAAWGYAYGQSDHLIGLARQAASEQWSFLAPAQAVERSLVDLIDGPLSDGARRAVIATLAQQLPHTLDRSLPRSVLELYPRAVAVLARFLEEDVPYDEDLFAKDVRFVAGAAVPAGAQAVDVLFSSSPAAHLGRFRRTVGTVGRLVRAGEPRRAYGLLAQGGMGDWLQIHTDTRDVADFNPDGWDRCYHRIADILVNRPKVAGMLGISWFYDPQLCDISPRLRYLQDRPLQNGAFLVRLKASALDAARASAASPTRRRLIEAGVYTPVCHALFWPRREMLQWAHKVEREISEPSPLFALDAA
ncbi:MAG: hypothetical protein ACYDD1_09695 [Caulobacteraceae bacterium]